MNIGPYYAQDSMYYKTADELVSDFEENYSAKLPTHREVCPVCDGKGSMVNRSIDGQGLSRDDPDLDEDFWEDYWGGRYDVVCDECHGRNVVEVVDEDRLKFSDPELFADWEEFQKSYYDSLGENLSELRMGA